MKDFVVVDMARKPPAPSTPAPPATSLRLPFAPPSTAPKVDRRLVDQGTADLNKRATRYVDMAEELPQHSSERYMLLLKASFLDRFVAAWPTGMVIGQKELADTFGGLIQVRSGKSSMPDDALHREVRRVVQLLRSDGVYVVTLRPKGATSDNTVGYRLPLSLAELRQYVVSDRAAARSSVRTNTEKLIAVCSAFSELDAELAELTAYRDHLNLYTTTHEPNTHKR